MQGEEEILMDSTTAEDDLNQRPPVAADTEGGVADDGAGATADLVTNADHSTTASHPLTNMARLNEAAQSAVAAVHQK